VHLFLTRKLRLLKLQIRSFFADAWKDALQSMPSALHACAEKPVSSSPWGDRLPRSPQARLLNQICKGCTYARAYQSSDQLSAELIGWLHRYNWHRPQGSLKANTPISRLGLSEDNLLGLHS